MSGLCERPGCSLPGEASYGMVAEELTFWIDHLDPSIRAGVLCSKHADSMSVPRGWTLIDRREPDLHLFSFRPPRSEAVPPPRTQVDTPRHRSAKPPVGAKSARAANPATDASPRSGFEQLPMMLPLMETADEIHVDGIDVDGIDGDGTDRHLRARSKQSIVPPVNAWPSPPGGANDGSLPFSAPVSPPEAVAESGVGDLTDEKVSLEELPLVDELTWNDPRENPVADDRVEAQGDTNKPWKPMFDQSDDLGGVLDVTTPLLRRAFRGGQRKTPGEPRKN